MTPIDTKSEFIIIENESSFIPNDFMKEIKAQMADFKEHLIRLEVKIDHYGKSAPQCDDSLDPAISTVDLTKLQKYGVPINSKSELDSLEKNLRDEHFRHELVSISFSIFFSLNI